MTRSAPRAARGRAAEPPGEAAAGELAGRTLAAESEPPASEPSAESELFGPDPTRTASTASRGPDPSLVHLFGRLAILEARVRAAVDRRRSTDPDPDDRFRGLYISDTQVDQLLVGPLGVDPGPLPELIAAAARVDARAEIAEIGGADIRLRRLERAFGLDQTDSELLLVALAPDLDQRFERLYAYLHDDVSRRRASVGLALELATGHDGLRIERHRLGPTAPLVAGGLVLVEDPDRPFLTRSLRVPDRVAGHLLGDPRPEPRVDSLLVDVWPAPAPGLERLVRALRVGTPLAYLRERSGTAGRGWAVAASREIGRPTLVVDLGRLTAGDDAADTGAALVREARLRGAVLIAGPIEVLAERGPIAIRAIAEGTGPTILLGTRGWDPGWSREVPLLLDAPVLPTEERSQAWLMAVGGSSDHPTTPFEDGVDPAVVTSGFRLDPEQVRRASTAARRIASAEDRAVSAGDVAAGARAQNAGGLERLARRVPAMAVWEDLILPGEVTLQLHQLTDRARHRERVLNAWGMGGGGARGSGVTSLFAGDSGTGKTLSAEIVAADLGLDLYVIDLATVVDKYIGETEKNLDRIFAEADRVNGVLLFDEADAIFGKRSEVKDARDRYANVEIAYLLQRMERFDGLAVLTTNLRANLDEAFLRRLDVIVDFPMPEEADRYGLWERHLPASLPRAADLDLAFLARAFKLSGGNIRNVCLAAAFFAAAEDRPVEMTDLIRGTEREYLKLGRLTHEGEFGEYFGMIEEH